MKKFLLASLAITALLACGDGTPAAPPERHQPDLSIHIVAQKVQPDTLVDQHGYFCTVPSAQLEFVDREQPYYSCTWSDTTRNTLTFSP